MRRWTGCGGTSLWSQHLGGKRRWIPVSLRPAWSTAQVLGHLGLLHKEALSQKVKRREKIYRSKNYKFNEVISHISIFFYLALEYDYLALIHNSM